MKSPFPGMDPFIEAQNLWGDFHDNLIIDIQRVVQKQLPPRYVARVSDRSYVEAYDPDLEVALKTRIGPDVEVQRRANTSSLAPSTVTRSTAVATPPLTEMHGLAEFEERETYLDIYKLDPAKQLVTSIEVLSPANKRRGSVGWEQYERKRTAFLRGHANLVEIDLLRGGKRHPMSEAWPASPYVITVFRCERAPAGDIWPAYTLQPLPAIPIPLMPPDEDVVVSLQPLVAEIYEASRYQGDIDYHRPLQPPLNSEEIDIVAQFLKENGSRES